MIQLKYDKPEGQIYQGNALEVLRSLPDESVNCCVTSPPYWGLRDYGTDGEIWGGLRDCAHVWGDQINIHKGGTPGLTGSMVLGGRRVCEEYRKTVNIIAGQFCQKCGAWFGSLGLEPTPELFTAHMVEIFSEVLRVLRPDGTLWLNLGDSYQSSNSVQVSQTKDAGTSRERVDKRPPRVPSLKPKDLCGIPWRVAFALQADGWYLRQDIIWHKPNPMPESVEDRCTKAHEYIFLLSKSQRYFYDHEAVKEPADIKNFRNCPAHRKETSPGTCPDGGMMNGRYYTDRNKRSVWTVTPKPFKGAHFATFPPDLIEPCILAGCPKGGTVLDPFFGSGTTGLVAYNHDRKFIGIELSEAYLNDIIIPRIEFETQQLKLFN